MSRAKTKRQTILMRIILPTTKLLVRSITMP